MSHDREPINPDDFHLTPGPIDEIEDSSARATREESRQRADTLPLADEQEPDSMEAAPETPIVESPDEQADPDLGTRGTRADPMR